MKENGIKLINSSAYHPQTNGTVEAFNKNIILKLDIILKENKKLNINKALEKAVNAYNYSIHSSTKIEPNKAFKFSNKTEIDNLLKNVIKSQAKEYKNYDGLKYDEKCLLNDAYSLNDKTLKVKFNKKVMYRNPIIIQDPLGELYYSFKVPTDILNLSADYIYKAEYKLIKRCTKEVWEYCLDEFTNQNNLNYFKI